SYHLRGRILAGVVEVAREDGRSGRRSWSQVAHGYDPVEDRVVSDPIEILRQASERRARLPIGARQAWDLPAHRCGGPRLAVLIGRVHDERVFGSAHRREDDARRLSVEYQRHARCTWRD